MYYITAPPVNGWQTVSLKKRTFNHNQQTVNRFLGGGLPRIPPDPRRYQNQGYQPQEPKDNIPIAQMKNMIQEAVKQEMLNIASETKGEKSNQVKNVAHRYTPQQYQQPYQNTTHMPNNAYQQNSQQAYETNAAIPQIHTQRLIKPQTTQTAISHANITHQQRQLSQQRIIVQGILGYTLHERTREILLAEYVH